MFLCFMFTAAVLHNQDIFKWVFVPPYQVTKEIPVFSVKVSAPLDYLAPRALKERGVSEFNYSQVKIVKIIGL